MPRVTELPLASSGPLNGDELVIVVQGGDTVQTTVAEVAAVAAEFVGGVTSVNGNAGTVVLAAQDVGATIDPSLLSAVSGLTGDEILTVEQSGNPVQATAQQIADLSLASKGLVGFNFTSDTSSTADSDPGGPGNMRWDNATQGSAVTLYFDESTSDGISLTTFWAGLAVQGYLHIQQASNEARWQVWKWTAVVDGSGYRKLAVTLLAKSTADISNIKNIHCLFIPSNSIGRHSIPIMASAMTPSTSGGCATLATAATSANHPDIQSLDFDTTTQEYAQFSIAMPKKWNEGTITFKPVWSHAATTTNFGVVWSMQAVACSDDDTEDVAYGTVQTSTDTGGTTNDQYVGPESSAITVAGSPAAEDIVHFRVSRVTADGSDNMAIDARLEGVILYITTDTGTDA